MLFIIGLFESLFGQGLLGPPLEIFFLFFFCVSGFVFFLERDWFFCQALFFSSLLQKSFENQNPTRIERILNPTKLCKITSLTGQLLYCTIYIFSRER